MVGNDRASPWKRKVVHLISVLFLCFYLEQRCITTYSINLIISCSTHFTVFRHSNSANQFTPLAARVAKYVHTTKYQVLPSTESWQQISGRIMIVHLSFDQKNSKFQLAACVARLQIPGENSRTTKQSNCNKGTEKQRKDTNSLRTFSSWWSTTCSFVLSCHCVLISSTNISSGHITWSYRVCERCNIKFVGK